MILRNHFEGKVSWGDEAASSMLIHVMGPDTGNKRKGAPSFSFSSGYFLVSERRFLYETFNDHNHNQ